MVVDICFSSSKHNSFIQGFCTSLVHLCNTARLICSKCFCHVSFLEFCQCVKYKALDLHIPLLLKLENQTFQRESLENKFNKVTWECFCFVYTIRHLALPWSHFLCLYSSCYDLLIPPHLQCPPQSGVDVACILWHAGTSLESDGA